MHQPSVNILLMGYIIDKSRVWQDHRFFLSKSIHNLLTFCNNRERKQIYLLTLKKVYCYNIKFYLTIKQACDII